MAGGLQLPGFLKPFLAELGVEWPDANEVALFDMAKAFGEAAIGFSGHRSDIDEAGNDMFAKNRGPAVNEIQLFYFRISGAGGHIMFTEAICAALAVAYGGAAALVLTAKLRIIALLTSYAAQKLALLAAILEFPQAAELLLKLSELTKEAARIGKEIIDLTSEALEPLLRGAIEIVELYADVAIPVLQARPMDNERDDAGGTPALPPGIDPDQEYRNSLANDPTSPYYNHPEWLPGNPPGRSSQPTDGQQDGGGVWGPASHGMTEGAKGQAYQEYVTGVQHPGGDGRPLELKLPDPNGSKDTRDFDGYVPAGSRGPGSPAVFQDAKDLRPPDQNTDWFNNHYYNSEAPAEAKGQLDAMDANAGSRGAVLEWHVSSREAADKLRETFANDPALAGRVQVFYTPVK